MCNPKSVTESAPSTPKQTLLDLFLFFCSLLLWVLAWLTLFPENYFLASFLLICLGLFFSIRVFEKKMPQTRELALLACLATLGVAGRAMFYFIPQVKPTAAIVFITGLSLGPGSGFAVGLLSMFFSNFLFGQSLNTPFQMLGMALVGISGGLLPKNCPKHTFLLSIFGFLCTLILYGISVDTGSALFFLRYQDFTALGAVYLAGLPFNLLHAGSTALFILPLSPLLTAQLTRVAHKYGLFRYRMVK